ncbi:hypothetical protein [Alteromonas oceanisediminis]|uniref:hypothetical protein n=1 Tax=Alteromonas oceanisediminis TaxID=2836180 RepID=UPI001BD9BA32|nr:hypothetical protein [Alteromonas oceanisediminis]MBT0585426.1 hypothetical protein [Alteromonas oceanisediminis]
MASKKAYPLRINANVLAAMQRWADDELRSVNAQIEYVLRNALVEQGRVKLVEKVVIDVEENDPDSDSAPKEA